MRTQEEIKKSYHKLYRAYVYLYDGSIRKEVVFAAADMSEAKEIAMSEVKKKFPSFADTLFLNGIVTV